MLTSDVSLVLVNANALTMQRDRPRAEAVAVAGDRILAVGSNSDIRRLSSVHTQTVDCHGLTLLPGFNDAHCHLPGLARRLQDLNCSPSALSSTGAPSIPALLALVREWAALRQAQDEQRLPGNHPSQPGNHPELVEGWVRGYGYDDLQMAEGRYPNRWELDAAAPENPVWLEHRSGHASALNSLALASAGIHRETPDPPGGVIQRDPYTGEPTGVLFEMRPFLRQRLGNLRSPREFEEGMRAAGQQLAAYGITSAQDAGADNGLERWRAFQQLQDGGTLTCRITMFAGAKRLDELAEAALSFGTGDHRLRLGHAKIMLTLTSGALSPSPSELETLVAEAHRRGFPVAIHCIEEEAIAAATEALAANRHPGLADRIEHCAEGTPPMVDAVRRSQAAVVTNPGFLFHNGGAYCENVAPRLLSHLYPAGALRRAGITVAFGSDAPVTDPNPWPAVYSAVTRRDSAGLPVGRDTMESQAVTVEEALRMYTIEAAQVEETSREKGSITPGKLADMVLVDAGPLTTQPEELAGIETVMTIIGGALVWTKL